jgi:hypothetical protein
MRPRSERLARLLTILVVAGAPPPAGFPAEDPGGSLTGWAEIEPIGYYDAGVPDEAVWLRTHLAWERRLSSRLLVRAVADVETDGRGEVARDRLFDDSGRDLERPPIRFEELSITWNRPSFDLAAGRMTLPWGRADIFNPTDNLTPFDTLDPLEFERLSSWAVRGRVYSGASTFEGDLIPFPGVTRLPALGDRWLPVPQEAVVPTPAGPRLLELDWRDGRADYPARRLENAAWGIRIDHRGSSWEGSISHYDGWDDQPVLMGRTSAVVNFGSPLPVALDRVQPSLRSTGGDLAWIRGRFALRLEAARDSRGAPADDTFTFYTAEGEWTAGDWRFIAGVSEIRGIDASVTTVSSFEQGALPAVMIHVERNVPTGLRASIQAIRNLRGEGDLVRGEVSWPMGQALRATAGVDLIDGPAGTFLGAFRHNDRGILTLRWSFAKVGPAGGPAPFRLPEPASGPAARPRS